jgi:hypothetical protein
MKRVTSVETACVYEQITRQELNQITTQKKTAFFLKLDIARAFDSVSWVFLLEVLQRLGFGAKWRDGISLTLSTSSSRVLLNGASGKPLKHERGLR